MEKTVTLCWATKKRHISIDGVVLCEPKHKTVGYSVKNGGYNTLSLSGLPTHLRASEDSKYSHTDGIIPFLPLSQQPHHIIESGICNKCKEKYSKLFTHAARN